MDKNKFSQTWQGLRFEQKLHRIATPLLLIVTLLALWGWKSNEPIVVVVPPTVKEEVRVGHNYADEKFQRAWALYVATIVGNVTPGNAKFLLDNLEYMMSAKVYQSIKEAMARQVDRVRRESLSITFNPESVSFETESGKVFVSGPSEITGGSGNSIKERRTYEMVVQVSMGKPEVTYFDVYPGRPKTLQVRKVEESRERRLKEQGKQ